MVAVFVILLVEEEKMGLLSSCCASGVLLLCSDFFAGLNAAIEFFFTPLIYSYTE